MYNLIETKQSKKNEEKNRDTFIKKPMNYKIHVFICL